MRLQRLAEHRSMPWANGGGTTLEIVAWPTPERWSWRLSLATVIADGPFSKLPGIERFLAVADGAGVMLRIDGIEHRLSKYESLAFPGDASTDCTLVDGQVRDLNLMVRSGSGLSGELRIERFARGAKVTTDDAVAVVVLDGAVAVSTPSRGFPGTPVRERAGRFDAFLLGDAAITTDGTREHTFARLGPVATAVADSVVALVFVR